MMSGPALAQKVRLSSSSPSGEGGEVGGDDEAISRTVLFISSEVFDFVSDLS